MARLTIINNKGTKYTIGADVLVTMNSETNPTNGEPINAGGANTSPVYFNKGKPVAVTAIDGGT